MTARRGLIRSSSVCAQDYNIALLGALGVGKSALTVKYITKRFINEYDPYLEDTYIKHEVIDNQEVMVHIMDTYDKEGQDPDRYMKWADAFIVVYSITHRQSFEIAHRYMDALIQHQRMNSGFDNPVILVGNKMDLERYRQVSKSEGNTLAGQYDSAFFETTAAEEYELVAKIFHETIREIIREQERQIPLRPLFISEEKSTSIASLLSSRNTNLSQQPFRRPKSPNPPKSPLPPKDRKDDPSKSLQKKNSSSFKFFNKIFQSS